MIFYVYAAYYGNNIFIKTGTRIYYCIFALPFGINILIFCKDILVCIFNNTTFIVFVVFFVVFFVAIQGCQVFKINYRY